MALKLLQRLDFVITQRLEPIPMAQFVRLMLKLDELKSMLMLNCSPILHPSVCSTLANTTLESFELVVVQVLPPIQSSSFLVAMLNTRCIYLSLTYYTSLSLCLRRTHMKNENCENGRYLVILKYNNFDDLKIILTIP